MKNTTKNGMIFINGYREDEKKEFKKISKKIVKIISEINELIKIAVDSDGDKLGVVDKTSTWQDEYYYNPIVFNAKTGRLTITYRTYSRKGMQKDVVFKKWLEFDGLPYLRDIKRQYKARMKAYNKYGY